MLRQKLTPSYSDTIATGIERSLLLQTILFMLSRVTPSRENALDGHILSLDRINLRSDFVMPI